MIELFNRAGEIPSNLQFSKEWYNSGKLNISDKSIKAQRDAIIKNLFEAGVLNIKC